MNDKTNIFIKKAISIHGKQYDYSKSEYKNVDSKLEIICKIPEHGTFFQTPYKHLNRKQGCPICGIEKSKSKRTKPFSKFLAQAIKIHGKKYDYSKSELDYNGAFSKIIITCKKHGDFRQTPDNHVNDGKGCYECGLDGHSLLFSRTQEEFIELAKEVHGNKYDYSLAEYKGADKKVTIICKEHGKWKQFASSHLKGHNCPNCTGNSGLTKDEFVEKAIKQHGEIYNYDKANYVNAHQKVKIECPVHGFFKQAPTDHIYSNGKGCPKCKETTGERKIRLYLESQGINYKYQKRFKDCNHKTTLPFDFYLPDSKTLIEFDGIQHFKPVSIWGGEKALKSQQKRDEIKNEFALENNYKLIRINYLELEKIEYILNSEIKTAYNNGYSK
ncbi:hypothetical protein AAFN75_17805 [Algibacter sp. AS12]|uniref:hypothetical protein n=1 Tax=Algibacter sp. AS12 TaxID=3135773 RepID=UPI00398B2791